MTPGCPSKFQLPDDDTRDTNGRVKHQVVIAKDEPYTQPHLRHGDGGLASATAAIARTPASGEQSAQA